MTTFSNNLSFFPPQGVAPTAEKVGFRFGAKGTHSSRTLMFSELEALLSAVPRSADRTAYSTAIIEGNCLTKATVATRRHTNQRLGELYSLDPRCPIFRVLRHLWDIDAASHPLLAMLVSLARDPLFMASASPVLALTIGDELQRAPLRNALRDVVGDRMNDAILDKVVRNISSSWSQSGHLKGRTFKIRQCVVSQPASLVMAIYLATAAGFHGGDVLSSAWVTALDCTPTSARALALEAKRLGLIDLHIIGDIIEFDLDRLDQGRSF